MSAAAVEPPALRVTGTLGDALAPAALAALDGEPLASYLADRRWYGAKGEPAAVARFAAVIPLRAPGVAAALTLVDVALPGGRRERYQLPLAVRSAGRRASGAARGTSGDARDDAAALARVEAGDARGVLIDATEEPAFREWLWEAFQRGETVAGEGARLVVESMPAGGAAPSDPCPPSRLLSAEQSNSSIVYGDRAILKLFRRLEAGESPEVEIARFLATRTTFRHTPALRGAARVEAGDGPAGAAGMLQAFVADADDAFSSARDCARHYLGAAPSDALDGPPSDAAPVPFAADAARLGAITRELHEALASDAHDPEFAPRPAGAAEVARWVAGAERAVVAGLDLLERRRAAGALGTRDAASADVAAVRRDDVTRLIGRVAGAVGDDAGQLVRHHGDYHLGQVLRTRAGDFFVIDFEGEPARPLAERRARNSALRDVAGMLRSFAYAAAIAAAAEDRARAAAAARSSRWEREVRRAFLAGYFGDDGGAPAREAPYLPRRRDRADALVALFEAEKLFYELAYELNNRPDWVWVPLAGVARLLDPAWDGGR